MDRFPNVPSLEELEAANAAQQAEYLQYLLERQRWEQDQAAIAEYESWFLAKTIGEAEAEGIVVK